MSTALPDVPSLADAADAPFVAHATWAAARTPGMRVLADPALVLADSGLPCDTFNVVCRARLDDAGAPERVRAATAHFRRAGRPFSWWVGPADRPASLGALLADEGLAPAESELAMAVELRALADRDPTPDGLTIARVRTPAALADFAAVCADSWTPPDPDVPRFFARAAAALLAPDCPLRFYVGYVDGTPVATAEAAVAGAVADGMVGLFNVATRTAWRRRGIGSALTLQPLREARADGVRTAVLQASAEGAGVYARLGFVAFGEVTEYKPVAGSS